MCALILPDNLYAAEQRVQVDLNQLKSTVKELIRLSIIIAKLSLKIW